jgi:hypothetical protein
MAKKKIGRSAPKARKPASKAKKRDPGDEFDKTVAKVFAKRFAAMQELRERERAIFRAVVESLRTATPLERAEGCCAFGLIDWTSGGTTKRSPTCLVGAVIHRSTHAR